MLEPSNSDPEATDEDIQNWLLGSYELKKKPTPLSCFMVKEIGEEGVDAEEAATSTEEVRIA